MPQFSSPSNARSDQSDTQYDGPIQPPQADGQGIQPTKSDKPEKVEYRFRSLSLPLAVYREVAAHLRQIDGVDTGLLPQTSKEFDYLQSQVGGLWIRYASDAADSCQPQIEAVLAYYGDLYGQWETLSTKV
ncbi:MAG: hypothetical protein ACFB0C_23205 [Leptolyngbyaceae cyanobacterium]